jgi:hypothetical protein
MDNPCDIFTTFAAQSLFLKAWAATMLLCDAFHHFTTAAVTRQLFLLHPSASRILQHASFRSRSTVESVSRLHLV